MKRQLTNEFAIWWARYIHKFAGVILLVAIGFTLLMGKFVSDIKISTDISALMPEGAQSVQTLNRALEKTGSFASIQIVAHSDMPDAALDFVKYAKTKVDQLEWVASSQYKEDIDVIAQHQLLLMSLEELQALEQDIETAYPNLIAQEISKSTGGPVEIRIRNEEAYGNSSNVVDRTRIDKLLNAVNAPKKTEQVFASDDGKTAVLIIWPKPGFSALSSAKRLVDDTRAVNQSLASTYPTVESGVAGRIASQVAQFNAIIGDLKWGLMSAVLLIAALITVFYRNPLAVPIIFLPLIMGIIWTLGLTTFAVGGLNLITAFLILILFGLGIDFGIHNFSRYREAMEDGEDILTALRRVIGETGHASLMASLTTACSFFALMLTEFRAFTEFGFIAGSGILLTFLAMYTVFPALLVLWSRLRHSSSSRAQKPARHKPVFNLLNIKIPIVGLTLLLTLAALIFAPKMRFETNLKNLEAALPAAHTQASLRAKSVLKTGNSRAIIVAETPQELAAIDSYFKGKIKADTETPTIKNIQSYLDFVPEAAVQRQRLEVIRRLKKRADQFQGIDPDLHSASQPYLTIDQLNISDLPSTLRRSLLGNPEAPGYLFYVDNLVNMDNSDEAKLFYDDVAKIVVNGETYFAASESFILVEMLRLMKADAVKAIAIVSLTTGVMVFLFLHSIKGMFIVLAAPLIGILVTVGIMGAFGPALSIMNMVILPSLVGISVDNGLHIYHRFQAEGTAADIGHIMNTTGKAALLTTLTTLIGFGGMITASMGGLRSMAMLAIIGFTACLLMTWCLLPVLMDMSRTRQIVTEEVKI